MIRARYILTACERFGCLPSQLLAEDASLARLLAIESLARPDDEGVGGLELEGVGG